MACQAVSAAEAAEREAAEAAAYEITGIVGLVLYAILCVVALWRLISIVRRSKSQQLVVGKVYHGALVCFCLFRLSWIVLHTLIRTQMRGDTQFRLAPFLPRTETKAEDLTDFILNRVSYVVLFSTWSVMIFSWAEIFVQDASDVFQTLSSSFMPKLKPAFIATNLVIYVLVFSLLGIEITYWEKGVHQSGWYNVDILATSVVFLVLSIAFLIVGISVIMRLRRARKALNMSLVGRSGGAQSNLAVSFWATIVATLAFLGRTVMFAWKFLTPPGMAPCDETVPTAVFITFAYYVPELLPLAFQVFRMRRAERKGAIKTAAAYSGSGTPGRKSLGKAKKLDTSRKQDSYFRRGSGNSAEATASDYVLLVDSSSRDSGTR